MSNVINFTEHRQRAEHKQFMECLIPMLRERALAYEAYLRGDTPTFIDPVPEKLLHLFGRL